MPKLIETVPYYEEAPAGFISLTDFCIRAGHATRQDVLRCINNGRIPHEYVISTKHERSGVKQFALFWNKAGYIYIHNRRQASWPEDFEPNDEGSYNPIDIDEDLEIEIHRPPQNFIDGKTRKFTEVNDISQAKYRIEQLKIEKMQGEIRLANNEAILVKDMLANDRERATELKALILRACQSSATLVASCSNVSECRSIIEGQFREAIETLNTKKEKEK